jgi:hypothetical protein
MSHIEWGMPQTQRGVMMRRRWPADLKSLLFIPIFAGGLWLLFVALKASANIYDEGLILVNAERVLGGQVPYRDFWSLYAPGYFYVLAGLFKLFGPNMLLVRIFDTLIRFALTLEVYVLARRLSSRWWALVPYAFVTLWLSAIQFYAYPVWPTLVCMLGVALVLMPGGSLRAMEAELPGSKGSVRGTEAELPDSRWRLAAAGLLIGLTAVMRLDFGGYTAAGVGLALAVYSYRQAAGRCAAAPQRLAAVVKAELVLAAGAAVIAVPVYGYLLAEAGLPALWNDLIVFPATTFRAMRHLPVPTLWPDMSHAWYGDWVRLYFPLGIYAAALIYALLGLRAPANVGVDRRRLTSIWLLGLSVVGLGLVVKATSRYHELHALPTAIVAALVATALFYRIPARIWRRAAFPPLFVLALAGLTVAPYIFHFTDMYASVARFSNTGCYSELPRAGCVPIGIDEQMAVQYLQAHTAPDEYVYVGNTRHDLIFVNDVLFYFLLGHPIPTAYAELHPGSATTLPVQQQIVNDLEAKHVRWVVRVKIGESHEPNASSVSSGVTYLDDYLAANFTPAMTFGMYQIYRR